MKIKYIFLPAVIAILIFVSGCTASSGFSSSKYEKAKSNSVLAKEGFIRSNNYLLGWLNQSDNETGLIPRNLRDSKDFWNSHDAAADNYAFMVLTAAIVNPDIFGSRMLEMLETERSLTSRLHSLPDVYSFSKKDFLHKELSMDRIIFGSSEYMKDGLLPLFDWLGPSPWYDRMKEIIDDLGMHVRVVEGNLSEFGNASKEEVNGDLLQVLSRMFWITGDEKYLEWAIDIGDYYLAEKENPLEKMDYLRIRDHGCEFIAGLSELYITLHFVNPEKKSQYQYPFHKMLDVILEKGRNDDGLFYNSINPVTGEIIDNGIADTWGYTFNAYYTVSVIDQKQEYLDAVEKGLSNLGKYKSFEWERSSSDGYADAIESALTLNNRILAPDVFDWIDSEIQIMWGKQKQDGIIEGWHGDGNFARTTLMYCLWKTQGMRLTKWNENLQFGAHASGDSLYVFVKSLEDWNGKLVPDIKRHKAYLNLPMDYPRINQFPEWYVIGDDETFTIFINGKQIAADISGIELQKGIQLSLAPDEEQFISIVRNSK